MQSLDVDLETLYEDTKTCAKLVGLRYIAGEDNGITRQKHGNGFQYHNAKQHTVDEKLKQRIIDLVIPPAWQDVWICPTNNGHVLATGIDERGRKQYIYHPKWRTMRDLIKFYRMVSFAGALPKVRRDIQSKLKLSGLPKEKVIAAMLWILDNLYIRVGNDIYFEENESVGLTTLTDRNVVIAGPVVTLAFKGKSNKDQQMTFENKTVAAIIDELRSVRGARLFRYKNESGPWTDIDADDINRYLREITGKHISAKDFRTWGGTLLAYIRLESESEDSNLNTETVKLRAVDQAAAVLGNTRTVARSSYVHPHVLEMYGTKKFNDYQKKAKAQKKIPGLDKQESNLRYLLEELFEDEFQILKKK